MYCGRETSSSSSGQTCRSVVESGLAGENREPDAAVREQLAEVERLLRNLFHILRGRNGVSPAGAEVNIHSPGSASSALHTRTPARCIHRRGSFSVSHTVLYAQIGPTGMSQNTRQYDGVFVAYCATSRPSTGDHTNSASSTLVRTK